MEISRSSLSFWCLPLRVLGCGGLLTALLILTFRGVSAPDDASLLLGNPCSLPCFYGVTPGETTRAQAAVTFAQYDPVTRVTDDPLIFTLFNSQHRSILVSIYSDSSGVVESIRLNAPPLLADVLLASQQPRHVFRTCNEVTPVRFLMTFGAADEIRIELFPGSRLVPGTRGSLFDMANAQSRSLDDQLLSFGCAVETGWLGFAAMWKYFNANPP